MTIREKFLALVSEKASISCNISGIVELLREVNTISETSDIITQALTISIFQESSSGRIPNSDLVANLIRAYRFTTSNKSEEFDAILARNSTNINYANLALEAKNIFKTVIEEVNADVVLDGSSGGSNQSGGGGGGQPTNDKFAYAAEYTQYLKTKSSRHDNYDKIEEIVLKVSSENDVGFLSNCLDFIARIEGNLDFLNFKNIRDKTILMQLIEGEANFAIVQLIIAKTTNINITDNEEKNALLYALQHKQPKIALCLIDNGSDLNVKMTSGDKETALMLAFKCGYFEVIMRLIEKQDPTVDALNHIDLIDINNLIAKNYAINYQAKFTKSQNLAIINALLFIDIKTKNFIALNADLNFFETNLHSLNFLNYQDVNDHNKTFLMAMIDDIATPLDFVQLIIIKTPDINIVDSFGQNALIYALQDKKQKDELHRGYAIAYDLIEKNSNLTCLDFKTKETALILAINNAHKHSEHFNHTIVHCIVSLILKHDSHSAIFDHLNIICNGKIALEYFTNNMILVRPRGSILTSASIAKKINEAFFNAILRNGEIPEIICLIITQSMLPEKDLVFTDTQNNTYKTFLAQNIKNEKKYAFVRERCISHTYRISIIQKYYNNISSVFKYNWHQLITAYYNDATFKRLWEKLTKRHFCSASGCSGAGLASPSGEARAKVSAGGGGGASSSYGSSKKPKPAVLFSDTFVTERTPAEKRKSDEEAVENVMPPKQRFKCENRKK